MEKDTGKKLIMLIGTIFVAAIFLSSYVSSSNNNLGSTTSTKPQSTYPAIGAALAAITGYGSAAHFLLFNQSNGTIANVSTALSTLEANSSISNYFRVNTSTGGNYTVELSGISAYELQQRIRNIPALANSNVSATAYMLLPSNVMLYVNSYPVSVTLSRRNYSLVLTGLEPVGSHLNVSVIAIITANGSVYGNQVRLHYK